MKLPPLRCLSCALVLAPYPTLVSFMLCPSPLSRTLRISYSTDMNAQAIVDSILEGAVCRNPQSTASTAEKVTGTISSCVLYLNPPSLPILSSFDAHDSCHPSGFQPPVIWKHLFFIQNGLKLSSLEKLIVKFFHCSNTFLYLFIYLFYL